MVCSLLFYMVLMHIYYYNRTLEIVGSLKDIDQSIQQEILHRLFTNSVGKEDGEYILMKNGYQLSGCLYLFFDFSAIVISFIYILVFLTIMVIFRQILEKKNNQVEEELDYLKKGVENFLFGEHMHRNNLYKECNYLLDRLRKRVYEANDIFKNKLTNIINFHQNIIHQINTPLSTLKILVEHLYLNSKVDKDYLENMEYAIEKASDLAKIYLKSAKMDIGKVKYQFEYVQLQELIDEILASLQVYASYYHSILINKCGNSILYLDILWIKEAIGNIVKNSIENAGCGKKVIISSFSLNDKVVICVDDNNVESLMKIDNINFNRFDSSQLGIGIGLHLCKQIIEAHLGEIKVEKSPLGGVRFLIILPKKVHKEKVNWRDYDENDFKYNQDKEEI